MGIRIQPREIEVPEDDPFKNDLLGRKEPVEILTHLLGGLEGPCVLAVDAVWGNGKTTFLKIWAQYLRNKEFPVVEFNAWETDFSGDPFAALSTELTEGLHEHADESLTEKIDEFKKESKEVLRWTVPGVIRLAATTGIPIFGPEVGQALASYAEERLSGHQEAQKSVLEFKHVLQDMADTLSKSNNNRPLVVVIDELDRCRPSYAVELLEVAKHLFAVDHVVFVLAINHAELAHSIRALYGSDFDAEGYLRRFFDVDCRLPEPKRVAFIQAMLHAIQIEEYFKRTHDQRDQQNYSVVRDLLEGFFGAADLSIRTVAQAIHRLGLMFASLRSNQRTVALSTVVALILRTIDSELYQRFIQSDVEDLEVVDTVFNRPGAKTLRQDHVGRLFEATIIIAAREMSPGYGPLYKRYKHLVDADEPDDPDRRRAGKIIELVEGLQDDLSFELGFRSSVDRLELLSPSLVDEPATGHETS